MRIAGVTALVLTAALTACTNTQSSSATSGADQGDSGVTTPSRDSWREVTIPEGTILPVVLDTPVASDTSHVEDPVSAHLAQPFLIDGVEVLPVGSELHGQVTEVARAGKVKGRAQLALRFDELAPHGSSERYDLTAATTRRVAPSEKKKDAAKIGIPAAGGAIVGGIVGGKKGAVIGGAIGAGAGTAVVVTDAGKEVRLGKGAALTVRLAEPLVVRVKTSPSNGESS
jgi:hypothetical protein